MINTNHINDIIYFVCQWTLHSIVHQTYDLVQTLQVTMKARKNKSTRLFDWIEKQPVKRYHVFCILRVVDGDFMFQMSTQRCTIASEGQVVTWCM